MIADMINSFDDAWILGSRIIVKNNNISFNLIVFNLVKFKQNIFVCVSTIEKRKVNSWTVNPGQFESSVTLVKNDIIVYEFAPRS